MRIIDLLNKIANGEEVPKKIKHRNVIWNYERRRDTDLYNYQGVGDYLSRAYFLDNILNEEVEILEEEKKIPEKIDVWYDPIKDTKLERHDTDTSIEILAVMCNDLKDKYNEILDYLNSKGE